MIERVACTLVAVFMAGAAPAQSCNDHIPRSTPNSRFVLNGATVTDTQTGLMWATCSAGQGDDNQFGCSGSANSYNWSEALVYAENSTLGGYRDWRLPNIKELQSIVEPACVSPAINLDIFHNTPPEDFWSASPDVSYSTNAWYVNFDYGNSDYTPRGNSYYRVRLVRDGQ